MKLRLVTALVVALATGTEAAECPRHETIYRQPGNDWVLKFVPVPRDAAANQISAFEVWSPGDPQLVMAGAIYTPNGFGRPLGVLTLPCGEERDDQAEEANWCEPFWEGPVYALVGEGIDVFPWDADLPQDRQAVPAQVLLPGFASNVWYSMLRQAAWSDDPLGDVFTFARCIDDD